MAPSPTSRGDGAEAQGSLSAALAKKHFWFDMIEIEENKKMYINQKKQLQQLCYMLYKTGWYLHYSSIFDKLALEDNYKYRGL